MTFTPSTKEHRMSATRTARKTAKTDTPAERTPKVEAKPKVDQTKLADLEQEMVATLRKEGVAADDVSKDTLKRWDNVRDEGRLQFYTPARYGSAHDSDWISPAVVTRVKKGVAS
jgi:hypothetical protein